MNIQSVLKRMALLCLLLAGVAKVFASTIIVSGNITSNTTWTNNNTYLLTGYVYVTSGVTLTINPGTLIQGDSATKGALIITRGAKISAIGTPCQPIVFTSEKPAGTRKRGDWGGVILLGYAAVNWPGDTGHIEGITPNPNTLYGGNLNPNCGGGDCPDNGDNSGTMEYVRIEFAGVALSPNNEINGLTFGGVGNGTVIDHIQVSFSNDDSYEWFGGHVDCKYIIAYDGIDDDFDTDNGFSGRVQFALGMRDPNVADVSGSKSFESDNDPNGDANLPQTTAKFDNVTALGGAELVTNPLFTQSIHTRRNTNIRIYNTICMGFPQGILIDGDNPGASTICNYATASEVANCYIQQKTGNYFAFTPSGSTCQAAATANINAAGIVFSTTYNGVLNNPNFPITNISSMVPAPGNPLPAANTTLVGDSWFAPVTYVGAFNPDGSDNWAGDWTNFDPVNTNYNGKLDYTPHVTLLSIMNQVCPNSGAVDIDVTKGITPYQYAWSNGTTTQDLSGVNSGTYTVTVYDAGRSCSVTPKKYKVGKTTPIITSGTATSTSVTLTWTSLGSSVTGYQYRDKLHSSGSYGPWISVGNATTFTISGLLVHTSYDFEIRGKCTSGATGISPAFTFSTTTRLANNDVASGTGASVNAYPNPNNGTFSLKLNNFDADALVSVKVMNASGEVVYEKTDISASDLSALQINLDGAANGLYLVNVSDGKNNVVEHVNVSK